MSTLSFIPQYHELSLRAGQPRWTPTDNPSQECVMNERRRIEQEGAAVETSPNVLESMQYQDYLVEPKREEQVRETTKRQLQVIIGMTLVGALLFLAVVYLFGSQLLFWMCPDWIASLNGVVAVLVETSVGAMVLAPAGVYIVRRLFRVETK